MCKERGVKWAWMKRIWIGNGDKTVSWKTAPDKDAVVFCISSAEWVSGCFKGDQNRFILLFLYLYHASWGLRRFSWRSSLPVRLADICQAGCWGDCWQTLLFLLLLLSHTLLQTSSNCPAPTANSSPSPGLVSSLLSPQGECEIKMILPGKQPRKCRSRTPTFPVDLNISGNAAKKSQTQQTRELFPNGNCQVKWKEGLEKRCREGPPGWSGKNRMSAERQACFHSQQERWWAR